MSVPGTTPSTAYLTTFGSAQGAFPSGTASFAFYIHEPPIQPVVIFRHAGATPQQSIVMSLTRDGTATVRLAVSAAGAPLGLSERLSLKVWNAVTITYAPALPASRDAYPLKLYVNGRFQFEQSLPLGAPTGDLALGIVTPTSTQFVIGFDDYVESPVYDAPIIWARVHYLMPLGNGGAEGWQKAYPVPACTAVARNWQLVSEDQSVYVNDIGNGNAGKCELGGGVTTSMPDTVDLYSMEGVPSKHVPSPGYRRELLIQPGTGSRILGVRLRMTGHSAGPPLAWSLGFIDQGVLVKDEFTFSDGGTGGPVSQWGPTRQRRPSGQLWSPAALNAILLRLDSGTGLATTRSVSVARLDYVWVP